MANEIYTNLVINTDGGSRNNPGKAGIGFVIATEDKQVVYEEGRYIGIKTNNEAEYTALLTGLIFLKENYAACTTLTIYSDSELMVRQLLGIYKIKEPTLKLIADQILSLLKTYKKYTINHVLRSYNKEADALVNKALDEEQQKR